MCKLPNVTLTIINPLGDGIKVFVFSVSWRANTKPVVAMTTGFVALQLLGE